jgi:hypothetical protein
MKGVGASALSRLSRALLLNDRLSEVISNAQLNHITYVESDWASGVPCINREHVRT